jgi:hypothetical protein
VRTIAVGFSKSTKKFPLGSWLIRLYQGTEFSHTYIKLITYPRFPSNKILHAAEGEVNHWSETNFLTRNKVVDEFYIEVPDDLYTELKNNIFHELAGQKYSMKQNIGIVLVHIAKIFGIKMCNPWQEGWNCSEYVLEVLQEIFPSKFDYLDPDLVTPVDIYLILQELREEGLVI